MEILLIAAVLPVVALCYYIYKKDANREPIALLRKIFLFGFLSAIPVIVIEIILGVFFPTEDVSSFLILFINTFVSVALVEEGFKWIVTKKFGYDNQEFDEVYDIIVYAVFASLGFACIENILYVFQYGLGNAITRALTSIPGHTCFAVIMGYFFSKAKVNHLNNSQSNYVKNLALSIIAPAVFHTLYDAIIFYAVAVDSLGVIGCFFLFDILMVVLCFNIVKRTSSVQKKLYSSVKAGTITGNSNGQIEYHPAKTSTVNYCPVCGKAVKGYHFCPFCGFKLQ